MEKITEQAIEAIMCTTATPMGWPEAFIYVGCMFVVAFTLYCITR